MNYTLEEAMAWGATIEDIMKLLEIEEEVED